MVMPLHSGPQLGAWPRDGKPILVRNGDWLLEFLAQVRFLHPAPQLKSVCSCRRPALHSSLCFIYRGGAFHWGGVSWDIAWVRATQPCGGERCQCQWGILLGRCGSNGQIRRRTRSGDSASQQFWN